MNSCFTQAAGNVSPGAATLLMQALLAQMGHLEMAAAGSLPAQMTALTAAAGESATGKSATGEPAAARAAAPAPCHVPLWPPSAQPPTPGQASFPMHASNLPPFLQSADDINRAAATMTQPQDAHGANRVPLPPPPHMQVRPMASSISKRKAPERKWLPLCKSATW